MAGPRCSWGRSPTPTPGQCGSEDASASPCRRGPFVGWGSSGSVGSAGGPCAWLSRPRRIPSKGPSVGRTHLLSELFPGAR